MKITEARKQEYKNLLTDAIIFLNYDEITKEQYKGFIYDIYEHYFKELDDNIISWLNKCGYHLIYLKEYKDKEGYERLNKESINAVNGFIKSLKIDGIGL